MLQVRDTVSEVRVPVPNSGSFLFPDLHAPFSVSALGPPQLCMDQHPSSALPQLSPPRSAPRSGGWLTHLPLVTPTAPLPSCARSMEPFFISGTLGFPSS